MGFTAIARLKLIEILHDRALSVGATLYNHKVIKSVQEIDDADLVIGADGVNSLVRRTFERELGSSSKLFENHFAWFGADRPFERLTQTFKEVPQGFFNAHHYRYSPSMSTFLVEVNAPTFEQVGFASMSEEESKQYCEKVFADELQGASLVTNKSQWRRFPIIHNARWSTGKYVLVGDALRTAHFSIGSGTRLAMEDVQTLVAAVVESSGDIPRALENYEKNRRPAVEKIVAAANESASWYDNFAVHMKLPVWEFAKSYISRSGRVDPERLRASSPVFSSQYEAWRAQKERA